MEGGATLFGRRVQHQTHSHLACADGFDGAAQVAQAFDLMQTRFAASRSRLARRMPAWQAHQEQEPVNIKTISAEHGMEGGEKGFKFAHIPGPRERFQFCGHVRR